MVIASITALLKNLLDNWLVQQSATTSLGNITVTALPPDRITLGAEERPQINLYLYRVTPNTRYRFSTVASKSPHQGTPLALDLHYLITTYGERDFQAEILLEHVLELLHMTPDLTPEIVQAALKSHTTDSFLQPVLENLSTFLQNNTATIKVTPEFLGGEELSKLWSMLQAHARLSITYKVSMVLIGTSYNASKLTKV